MKASRHPSSDRIDYVVTDGHPNETTTSIYHFYRGADGRFYDSSASLVGEVADLPLSPSDVTTVWNARAEGSDSWQWDIAHDEIGNPVILFASIASADSHTMHYARWTETRWLVHEMADVGGTVAPGVGEDQYSAGGALDPAGPDRVWLAKERGDGNKASLWKYETDDGGISWSGKDRTPGTAVENLRPVVPENRSDAVAVLFMRGRYAHYTHFDTELGALPLNAPSSERH